MAKLKYNSLSKELEQRMIQDRKWGSMPKLACADTTVLRRKMDHDQATMIRPAFIRDIEKILHIPYYNRYADKTQVFSFYRNDDISRRGLHVQLVSRIARNIGRLLNLNLDLIEAISLGHDIGHTPFGHAGERILNGLLYGNTGRFFNHNVQSVRVLDDIFARNISLQTLDGILCHNGEFEQREYRPKEMKSFEELDREMELSYTKKDFISTLVPSTLEACVVRISDMIAYLGKDRQDARSANIQIPLNAFSRGEIGIENAEMIHNLTVNLVENSYGQNYLKMDEPYYQAIKIAKRENYKYIYFNEKVEYEYNENIRPMFEMLYEKLLQDLKSGNRESVIYSHHIDYVNSQRKYYKTDMAYEETEKNQIVTDYLASMTDDYFIDLFQFLFPNSHYMVKYIPYFPK